MILRTDHRTSALIALALFLGQVVNRQFAAKMLARHRTPFATARRVLATPDRRSGDNQTTFGTHL